MRRVQAGPQAEQVQQECTRCCGCAHGAAGRARARRVGVHGVTHAAPCCGGSTPLRPRSTHHGERERSRGRHPSLDTAPSLQEPRNGRGQWPPDFPPWMLMTSPWPQCTPTWAPQQCPVGDVSLDGKMSPCSGSLSSSSTARRADPGQPQRGQLNGADRPSQGLGGTGVLGRRQELLKTSASVTWGAKLLRVRGSVILRTPSWMFSL